MSDILSSTPFPFEKFPGEILLEIFKYMEPVDLHSFMGHNRRIDNVIRDVKLNIVIQHPLLREENLNYLSSFLPNQFIRLDLNGGWEAFDISLFKELRSLKLNCNELSEEQFDQVSLITLYGSS